jgi:hypothetical protein
VRMVRMSTTQQAVAAVCPFPAAPSPSQTMSPST